MEKVDQVLDHHIHKMGELERDLLSAFEIVHAALSDSQSEVRT